MVLPDGRHNLKIQTTDPGFAGVDELAARLGVAPIDVAENGMFQGPRTAGLVIHGHSGNRYDWTALLLAHLDYVDAHLPHSANSASEIEQSQDTPPSS